MKKGDRILKVDGKGPGDLTLEGLRSLLRNAPEGTRVQLQVATGTTARNATLVSRQLL